MHTSSQSPLLNKRQSPLLMKSSATDTDIGAAGMVRGWCARTRAALRVRTIGLSVGGTVAMAR